MVSVVNGKKAGISPENFCYWLQGLFELTPDLDKLDKNQVKMIKDHLGYVFTHLNDVPNFDLGKALTSPPFTTIGGPLSPQGSVQIC